MSQYEIDYLGVAWQMGERCVVDLFSIVLAIIRKNDGFFLQEKSQLRMKILTFLKIQSFPEKM